MILRQKIIFFPILGRRAPGAPPGSAPVYLPSRDAKHNLVLVSMLHFHSHIDVKGGRRGRDRIVVGFTTTHAINAYHH
jgi:hypothetical protein